MFTWAAAFCTGVIILYCGGFLLPWYVYILLLIVVFIWFRPAIFCLVFFFSLGHAYANFSANQQLNSILPVGYEGKPLTLRVYLCSLPKERERYHSAEFCVVSQSSINGLPPKNKLSMQISRVLLYWPKTLKLNIESSILLLNVRLKRPHGTLNPVGGGYEKYLFYHRISATGVVIENVVHHKITLMNYYQNVHFMYVQTRLKLSRYLDTIFTNVEHAGFTNLEHAGLFKALILGDRGGISALDSRTLSVTGTQHLMAISGLHVGVVLLGLFYLLPRNRATFIFITVTGVFYIASVGFSASAQRAWIMCVITMVYLAGYGSLSRSRAYLIALTLVLLIDPLATLNIGFWFSFICVALLLFLLAFGLFNKNAWYALILIQIMLFIGLTPINSYLGLSHSLSNGLANLIAIPLVSLLVLPGALLSFFISLLNVELGQGCFLVLNEVLHLVMVFLSSLDAITWQVSMDTGWPTIVLLGTCLLASVILFRFKGLVLIFVLAIVVLFIAPAKITRPDNRVVVFDSGQGLALAMVWAGQVWLYDTGPVYERSSIAESVILPYLMAGGLQDDVTGVIVSHGDKDHAGGIKRLFSSLFPMKMWGGEVNRLPNFDVLSACAVGMKWQYKTGLVEVLYPFKQKPDKRVKQSSNNQSCVVRFTLNGIRFLLMGDLERDAERQLVRFYHESLKADVLIAGHHGSKNSSSYALLKYVQPKVVVFSAGYLNRFGHPHKEVLERVKVFGPKVYVTANDGSLVFDMNDVNLNFDINKKRVKEKAFNITTLRNKNSPFWVTNERVFKFL